MMWPLPWWMGALALGGLTVGFWFWMGRPLGVSACWTRLVNAREDARLAKAEAEAASAPEAFAAALLAATQAEFGVAATLPTAQTLSATASAVRPTQALRPRAPWTAHLVFLLSLGLGGALAAWSRGAWSVRSTLGPEFEALFGRGWTGPAVLLLGGVLVGFGTRMCGGCSSGHGLSGCSRLQVGSLVSTACFFGAAVLTALVLVRWLR